MTGFKPLTADEKAAIWWGMSGQALASLIAAPDSTVENIRNTHICGGDIFGGYRITRTLLVYVWHSVIAHRTSGVNCTERCTTGINNRWSRLAICNPDDRQAGHHDRWERIGTYRTAQISFARLTAWACSLSDDVAAPIKATTHEERVQISVGNDHWLRVQLLGPREYPTPPRREEPESIATDAGDQFVLFEVAT